MTLLVTGLMLTGCGPREGRAEDRPGSRANDRRQAPIGPAADAPTGEVPAGAAPSADTPAPPALPADPKVVALAQAHIEGLMADYQTLFRQVEDVRSALLEYRSRHGRAWSPPKSSPQPWQDLMRSRLLWSEPANPFSPPKVASRIHEIREPGVGGEAVSPKTAGWVWNSADGVLDVARDSAAIRACGREDERRTIREKVGPYLNPRLELMRAQIALYQLYEADDLWRPGEVDREQWTPLVRAGYVNAAPQNPMSPPETATTIVEIKTAGAGGKAVDPVSAGWVWNSADRKLFAAGYDG
jgi:hypothetical protein